jgi:hypothetical protein
MKRARLFLLIEGYLGGAQSPDERRELEAAVRSDADVRATFIEQVRLARCLQAGLRRRAPEELWRTLEPLLDAHEHERRQRTADAVDARIDEQQRAAGARATRRRRVGVGLLLALSLGGAAMALTLRTRWRSEPVSGGGGGAPALVETDTANRQAPPPARTAPPAPRPGPQVIGDNFAAAEPQLAGRNDLLFHEDFDQASAASWWGQSTAALGPGLTGKGLEVRYLAGGGRPIEPGVRAVLDARPAGSPGAGAPDEVFLRYYVRLSENFDFGPGGVLPGVCGGRCGAPPRSLDGIEAWAIRLHWSATGEIGLEHVPHAQLPLGWNRTLTPGRWHALELRVKLNDPAAADGVIEGWFDGEKVASRAGLRLRSVGTLHADGVVFDTFYRGHGQGPSHDVQATFDDLVLATSYVGPRADR